MDYQFVRPSPALRPFVEEYILLTPSLSQTKPEQIPPGGKTGLCLNLGADFRADLAGVSQLLPAVAVGGQLTQLLKLSKPADGQILLINFQPTGLHRLFGWPMAELTNLLTPMTDLVATRTSQSWYSLVNQLRDTAGTLERIQRVETHLLACVNRVSLSPKTWVEGAATWLAQPGDRRIQQLLTEVRVSPRHLTRVFGQQVGLTPKYYAQVMRFRNVFRVVTNPNCPTWQDLVYAGGWYDQAHFCNDLYRMTGQTPTAFFTQHHAIAEMMINRSPELIH